jgi:MFS family permease
MRPLKQMLLGKLPFDLAAFGLIMGCITYLQLIYAPFVLADMGAGPKLVSFAMLGDAVTGILTSLLFGRFRRYISASSTFVLAFIATGVGGIVVSHASDYIGVAIGLAVTGLGVGWLMPNLMLLVGNRTGREEQGRAAGLVKGANYMGAAVCVAATEWLSQKYGPRIPLLVSAALSFSLAALVIYQDSRYGKLGIGAGPRDVS